jgi:4-alpha-glucanotransferase
MTDAEAPFELGTGLPRIVCLGRAICGELEQAERREWWLANGLGAYACGTVAGSLTRRYHGLLIVPLAPPLGRRLLFVKADPVLRIGEREWALTTNRWADGAVSPAGHTLIESFRLEGRMPVWRFAIGDLLLEQRVWMVQGEHTTGLAYRVLAGRGDAPLEVRLALLGDDRDHHQVTTPGAWNPTIRDNGDRLRVGLGGHAELQLIAVGGCLEEDRAWIEHFDLPVERERGLEDTDSHLRLGRARLDLSDGDWCGLVTTLARHPTLDLPGSMGAHQERDRHLLKRSADILEGAATAPGWIHQLVLAADTFLFRRPLNAKDSGMSVIAGYPWFGDWGRDTMIALPGLTLATGRLSEAHAILTTFAGFVDRGMLPNTFPGAGERPAYNTVDAALWYIEAWRAYLEASGDLASLSRVFPVLEGIITQYRHGTRYGIHMDPSDGLIWAGEPGLQLTWMDAKVDDWVITPRMGKPVEINALWYNALCVMYRLARTLGREAGGYRALSRRARRGFRRYRGGPEGGLYDVLDGPRGDDPSLRPNQILAVSLPFSPLDPATRSAVVAVCGRRLLCSHGLRSLAPDHPDYQGAYAGDVPTRDRAYHQGTVWAWLLGHYAVAEYRVSADPETALARLAPIREHLTDAALGSVSEIFDGDPPHRPRGAPAQAWSVACMLEAWWRITRKRGGGRAAPEGGATPLQAEDVL